MMITADLALERAAGHRAEAAAMRRQARRLGLDEQRKRRSLIGQATALDEGARELVARVDRAVAALPEEELRVDLRAIMRAGRSFTSSPIFSDEAPKIIRFRADVFVVAHPLVGEIGVSRRSGRFRKKDSAFTPRSMSAAFDVARASREAKRAILHAQKYRRSLVEVEELARVCELLGRLEVEA